VSQENVEIVRRSLEGFRAGDYDRATSEFEPYAEWHNTDAFPGPKVCSGIEEIREFWKALMDTYDREGMHLDNFAQAGNTVVVRIHEWGTGKASGVPIDIRWAPVYELRDRKIVSVKVHGNWDKALEAVGLSEQDAHPDS
jgi:ketosteroid isomerase-like protein